MTIDNIEILVLRFDRWPDQCIICGAIGNLVNLWLIFLAVIVWAIMHVVDIHGLFDSQGLDEREIEIDDIDN